MKEEKFTLQTMLDALYKIKGTKVKKRLVYDQKNLDGIASKWVKVFFFSLPVLLFIGIFNPYIFSMLGIASAVVFYIVFLSMTMIIIAGLTFANNNKVLRQITPSWDALFPTVSLPQVLVGGATPYKDFVEAYTQAVNEGLQDNTLYERLKSKFLQMQEENRELYERMNPDAEENRK